MKVQFGKIVIAFLAIGLITGIAYAADTKTNILAYWPLDGNANDIVGKHNGKLVGGASFVQDAKRGQVLKVNGIDGRLEVPHADDIIFTQTDSYTLSVWVSVLVLPGRWSGVVAKSRDISPWYGIWIDNTNKWVAGGTNLVGTAVVADGWHHLALVQNGIANTRTLYLDGKVNVAGTAIAVNGKGDLWMGGAKSVSEYLNALIDDVVLYKRALTPDDIQSLIIGHPTAVDPATRLIEVWGRFKR